MSDFSATYSPDDNKLRLYAASRLEPELYARVRAAGFIWAPKQQLFVAPMWTPERADLCEELAGEIGDEDTSLVDRAEERAERFEGYSENRAADADAAQKAVAAIADNIPLGQPILVGHHSERHARKDAERIENGMRRAVKLWETSKYWTARAAGALRHAKYKERPDVRARRIKGLAADQRKQQKALDRSRKLRELWKDLSQLKRKDGAPTDPRHAAVFLGNHDGGHFSSSIQHRSGYIGPMSLWEAAGGNIDGADPETRAYATVEEIQAAAIRNHGAVIWTAERWLAHIENRLAYERAMLGEAGGLASDRTGPQKGGAVKCWASHRGGWSWIVKVNRVSVSVLDNWGNGGGNFKRVIPFDKLSAVMTPDQVQAEIEAGRLVEYDDKTGFFILDAAPPKPPEPPKVETPEPAPTDTATRPAQAELFEAMRETLRAGVKVVSAPQLFPTPPAVAAQMVELARIELGNTVLEPSAGTGALLAALPNHGTIAHLDVIEINPQLCTMLQAKGYDARALDFLTVPATNYCPDAPNGWDRILMNPPFENGSDIKHIKHALTLLKPGGRLVAICANGPRQNDQLKPLAAEWIDLEAGTFAGTSVRSALLVIDKE